MFATLSLLLYVAHLIADYPAQTDHQAAHKADPGASGWLANLAHAGTHLVLSALALLAATALPGVHLPLPLAAAGLVWVTGTHAVIDRRWPVRWWMEHTGQRGFLAHGGAAHVDQTFHIAALITAAYAMTTIGGWSW